MNEILKIENVIKSFGKVQVLNDINLSCSEGEFISLLGPSGCGKTTILRILAGLEQQTAGSVYINGKNMEGIPPYKRGNGMVFQNYALFPHLTVKENILFGLKHNSFNKNQRNMMIEKMIPLMHLDGLENRYPREMSGGQQQRVALARGLVLQPNLLLLDEPLSNLDAKLRKEMQVEIRNIQKSLNVTAVFVTHDQEEAMVMSDRIAVMNKGVICQIGTPNELYDRPKTRFVASFIGTANILEGISLGANADGLMKVKIGTDVVFVDTGAIINSGDKVLLSLRPERIMLRKKADSFANDLNIQQCRIISKSYLGKSTKFQVQLNDGTCVNVERPADSSAVLIEAGDDAFIGWGMTAGICIEEDDM